MKKRASSARADNEALWEWNLASDRIHFSPRWISLAGCEEHGVLGIDGNAAFLEDPLALEHLSAERFEVDIQLLCLREHLAFFLFDVMADTLGQYREFCIAVIIAPAVPIEFGDEDARNVVFLVGLIHDRFRKRRARPASATLFRFFLKTSANRRQIGFTLSRAFP